MEDKNMSMTWEEIAESRLQEIRRLRDIVNRSTLDSFIIEHAISTYNASRKAFYESRKDKADDAPTDAVEIRRMAEMRTIADFIAALELMGPDEFIAEAEKEYEED
jgi:hypothetical protein